ncbi:MAG TPA: 16S rRNA (cytidine(1402)-2'-O)-methyltransferase [Candidatus Binataceae bacterium]|nr:16S rRNA (cytidine(1402)-2'-O)-methyltransferase [Candidatus Binataceae bacterium]
MATPIGNAEDLSARAIRVLREAELIACEDTRRCGRLLAAHEIRTPTVSYFEHNEERRTPELVARLAAGAMIALVTDAGTPAISDPGYRLVRAAIAAGIRVTAIPGASAVVAALSIAGLPTDRFVFEGFLPAKSGERHRALQRLEREARTMVFYEAARRLAETLAAMAAAFGGARAAVVVRELTKTHEETVRGTLGELTARFKQTAALGEVTIVVAGNDASASEAGRVGGLDEAAALDVLRADGLSLKDASAVIAKLTGTSRREVYQRGLRRRPGE